MTDKKDSELIVLVDDNNNELGTSPKLASHHSETPLHRGFSCYIFNEKGEVLVTQRALVKKVWPGVWTNSVCGHPGPNESVTEAIIRRSKEELGMEIKDLKPILEGYRYKTPPYNGIIENEICPVYSARASTTPNPNPEEVEDLHWSKWEDFVKSAKERSEEYSYWCKDQLKQLDGHPKIKFILKNKGR